MSLTAEDFHQARILIVDDQAANVSLLEQLLEAAGFMAVSSVMDPLQVCALHRRHDYDLILLDLQMPGMDGFQVIEALKTNERNDFLPVIVVTAQPGHRQRALEAGVRDFISKPFDLLEVRTRIRNMLEVRLLYRMLERQNEALEQAVAERTAELRESEARYRSLTELASDWYWEQDEYGHFTRVSGPVLDMLGIRVEPLADSDEEDDEGGWNETERSALLAAIDERRPFLDFILHRRRPGAVAQVFQVSGEPMFNQAGRFVGYRGIGAELSSAV